MDKEEKMVTRQSKALSEVRALIRQVEALTLIRKNYEKKFGIRMFANGEFVEIGKEEEA